MRNQEDPDSIESPRNQERATENQNAGNIEKIIHIETCRNCKDHRQSTWHDETKYETNFNLVKEAIEELVPGVEVLKNTDEPRILGGFEIMHKEKVLFSKKTSGLWPNAKAVAHRVQLYFEDLAAGKDVSAYGTQKEKAYTPKRQKGEKMSYTGGVTELYVFNPKYAKSTDSFSPARKSQDEESAKKEENNNDLPSEQRENEEQNEANETKPDEKENEIEKEHKQDEQENPDKQQEAPENQDQNNDPTLTQNGQQVKDKPHKKDSAQLPPNKSQENQENLNESKAQEENKIHGEGTANEERAVHEENGQASEDVPKKEKDEQQKEEISPVSKNAETTGENPPANFMFAAVKGLTANIHNQGDVKENKDESPLKEEYPEDFNA